MNANLKILTEFVRRGLEHGLLTANLPLNMPQREASQGLLDFLTAPAGEDSDRQRAYFDMATGTGKTGLFSVITRHAHLVAQEQGQGNNFRTIVVVPTNLLLRQTHDALQSVAPELRGGIGLFGGGARDFSKPITIMTYDAWVELLENGQLGANDIALEINDEAHHGLSLRRQSLIRQLTNTIHLGTTATAQYDINRTLEHTHQNLVYKLGLRDAVERGFLADYIHVQYALMRILPAFAGGVAPESGNVDLTLLKRREWAQLITKTYATMDDGISGQPLSDKVATFFAADTRHADGLARMLNDDPVLQAKARDNGFQNVAISIHSVGHSEKETLRRLEDFQAGAYMAAVGDKVFQAGFNYPRVKYSASYPGNSAVDIVQQIGRSTRHWIDPNTGISQGTVAFEAIPYIGHQDALQETRHHGSGR